MNVTKVTETAQVATTCSGRAASRVWLVAGAALLTWQVNNQVVKADTTPVSTENTTISVAKTEATTAVQDKEKVRANPVGESTKIPAVVDNDESSKQLPTSEATDVEKEKDETLAPAESSAAPVSSTQTTKVTQPAPVNDEVEATSAVDTVKQPTENQVQLRAYRVAAMPQPEKAAVDAHTSGTWGTSKWTIDTTDNTLHIGAGTVTNTGVKVGTDGRITDWGALDWQNYKVVDLPGEESGLKLRLDGPIEMGADASYAFSNLIFDVDTDFSDLNTDQTTNMTGLFMESIMSRRSRVFSVSFNTENVTTMAHMFDKFLGAYNSLGLMDVNTEKVTDMSYMFAGAEDATLLSIESLDTSNVTNMAHMFSGCRALVSLDLSNFKTGNVKSMAGMFENIRYISALDLSMFDTGQVTDMASMFANDNGLRTLDISSFDTSKVTTMAGMFLGVGSGSMDVPGSISGIDSLNTTSVRDMSFMFAKMNLAVAGQLNLKNFDTSRVTNMESMFNGVSSGTEDSSAGIKVLDLSSFDTSNVTNMASMLANMTQLEELDLSNFDTSHVTNMTDMLANMGQLKQLDLSNFDTSRVTTMAGMLANMTQLESVDLSNFDTSHVTNMAGMFKGDTRLTNLDISNFNTVNVTNMSQMFMDMAALTSLNWGEDFKTNRVTDMSGMFMNVGKLTELDLHNFDTSQVVNMNQMFMNMASLTSLDLSRFDTSQVTGMAMMFMGDSKVVELDLRSFNTLKVNKVLGMFANNPALERINLSSFNLKNIQLDYVDISSITPSTQSMRIFGMFNVPQMIEPESHLEPTSPKVLILGKDTILSVDHPAEKLSDIMEIQPGTVDGPLELYAQIWGIDIEEIKNSFFSANLYDAGGRTGLWVNIDTGKQLKAQQMMVDADGNDPDMAGTWIWQNITGKDAVLIASPKTQWSPKDNFDLAVDEKWNPIALDQLTVTVRDKATKTVLITINPKSRSALNLTDTIDFSHPGEYEVLYSYDGADGLPQSSGPVNLIVIPSQAAVKAHNSIIQLGDDWQVDDNLHGAVNADGSRVDISEVTMSGMVKTQVPGIYQVTYQFTDKLGMLITKTIQVIVNGLTIKQDTANFSTDDHWNPQTNVAAAMDDRGRVVSPEQMTIILTNSAGQVVTNLKRPGQYSAIYRFNDDHGVHTQTANITITAGENFADLKLKTNHTALYEGDVWNPFNYVQLLVDSDGEQISQLDWPHRLQVDGTVNTNQAGDYQLTYHFTDLFGERHQAKLMVTVKPNQAGLVLNHDVVTLYVGSSWQAEANVASATDVDGQTIPLSQMTISNDLDLTRPGSYLVTYRFTDLRHRMHTATTVVTVLANQADLSVKSDNVQLYKGENWNAIDNLASVTDVDGSVVAPSQVSISSNVDLAQPGDYLVTYWFTDRLGVVHTAQTQVILKNKEQGGNSQEPGDGGQTPKPEPSPDPDSENPGQQPGPTTPAKPNQPLKPAVPDKQPVTDSLKQQTAEETGESDGIKTERRTSPIKLRQPTQAVRGAQAAIKLEKSLPQTDEQANKRFSIMGLAVLVLSSLELSWFAKRKKQSER